MYVHISRDVSHLGYPDLKYWNALTLQGLLHTSTTIISGETMMDGDWCVQVAAPAPEDFNSPTLVQFSVTIHLRACRLLAHLHFFRLVSAFP
jgi:hypothetical protein